MTTFSATGKPLGRVLILGGTAWLGREIGRQAAARGHDVTCLARGDSGEVPPGTTLVPADRSGPGAYKAVVGSDWDAVIEVSWQPAFVREALDHLADRAAHWTCVSSASVYADHSVVGGVESAEVLPPTTDDRVNREQYGRAKVTCEQLTAAAVADRLLVARAGLIGGPGDHTDRSGAWIARAAAAPTAPMLVPEAAGQSTQMMDVRDFASWLLDCAGRGTTGTYDAFGPVVPFDQWVTDSRRIGGHTGQVVRVPGEWLVEQDVEAFMGPESLAMWLPDADFAGFMSRSGAAAREAGLEHRPATELLADVLRWERTQGLERPREAGLSLRREQELLDAWRSEPR